MQVKEWVMSMLSFHPTLPKGVRPALLHPPIFRQPFDCLFPCQQADAYARNFFESHEKLENTSRQERHINPWNHPVKVHTYEEYEDEFRESMKEVGLPVEKE